MPATAISEELQFTELRFLLLPSLYLPVAVNCWALPFVICALDGVIVIEVRVGAGSV